MRKSSPRLSSLVIGILLAWITSSCSATPVQLPTEAPLAALQDTATALVPPSPTHTPPAEHSATPPPSTPLPATPLTRPTHTPTPVPAATATPEATACAAPGHVESGAFTRAMTGAAHRYSIYLPPCYAADGRNYPVLYLLAGNIHDETKWDELGIDEAANAAILEGGSPPLLIVMPDGGWIANNTSGGPGSYETVILDELIPHVEGNYCAWAEPAGRAIGGLSRGGYWALEMAFRFPHAFASVGGHSAALLDQFAGPTINPQFTALNNDLGSLRVYLDIGDDDYLRTNTINLHEDMAAAGVQHEWRLNEGQHVDDYWAQHVADYLAWYVVPWSTGRDSYPACTSSGP